MKLEFSTWTTHLNHIIYSYFYYCKNNNLEVDIVCNKNVVHNCCVLFYNNQSICLDYSDDTIFLESPKNFNFYFKRSLKQDQFRGNIYPLNFNVPLAYKCHSLLMHLKIKTLLYKPNREHVFKAIDKFALFAKASHGVLDVRRYPNSNVDHGGTILFQTRLWNPDNHPDKLEKERRILQNNFRINACRIIKNNFKNAAVGLVADEFAFKMAPDLILNNKNTKKTNYFNTLLQTDIGIADDGLKDTPGWKIGEYLLYGKAVITTPLNVVIDDFIEHKNFEQVATRNAFEDLPGKIESLLKNKRYLEVGAANFLWSDQYIHPKNYISRIIDIIDNQV